MLRAVIIDDEKWSRNIIKNFGKWDILGIEIVGEADDGESGLELIARTSPQIILTDMNMPNVDGVSLLKTLQAQAAEAKIIVISGYDDFAYMKQAIQSKACEYLLKPIDAAELNRVLEQCVLEIYLNRQNDTTMILEMIEIKWMSFFIDQRKLLSEPLSRRDIQQVTRLLDEMITKLREIKADEKIISRLVLDQLSGLLQELVLLPAAFDERVLVPFRQLKKDVDNGLALAAVTAQLLEVIQAGFTCSTEKSNQENQSVVNLVKDYIDKHFMDTISLEKIAGHFYISKEYLSYAFKLKFQINLSQYVLQLKMEEAKRLLRSGCSHTEVANRLGYQDKTYFYKVFKKYFGCTPSEMEIDK